MADGGVLVWEKEGRDQNGVVVIKQHWESLSGPPTEPVGARNVERLLVDGKYSLDCDIGTDPTNYRVVGSLSQEPIETHEMFSDVSPEDWEKWAIWKKNPSDPLLADWDPKTVDGISTLLDYYARGVTSFLVPTVIVRQTIVEDKEPKLDQLGKISTPPIPIATPGKCNFIQSAAEGSNTVLDTGEEGAPKRWENNYEWRMSGAEGWDEGIYGNT